MTGGPEAPPVPRVVRFVAALVLAAGVLMALLGAWRIGVTWDEPIHVQRLNQFLETGWFLTPGQLEMGDPTSDMTQQFVYAPVAMLLLHGLGMLTGIESADAALFTHEAYVVRHLGVALLGFVGVGGVALTAKVLTRRWDWALVAAAALVAVPLWTGHSMFNIKDTPAAVAYVWVTLALCLMLRPLGDRWWHRAAAPLALGWGVVLGVGTRPGMWTGFALSAMWFVLAVLFVRRADHERAFSRTRALAELGAGIGLGLTSVALVYPSVFADPVRALLNSLTASANFMGGSSNRGFLPIGVLLQMPLVLLGLALLGTLVTARRVVRERGRSVETACWVLVVVQLFGMPTAGVLKGSFLYGDLRQVLFAVPAMVLMAMLGAMPLLRWRGSKRYPVNAKVSLTVLVVGLVFPTAVQASLFPLNYIFWNPLSWATPLGNNGGDFYRASARELVKSLPPEGRVVCSPIGDEDGRPTRWARVYGWLDCRTGELSPMAMYTAGGPEQPPLGRDEFWVASFGNLKDESAENCKRTAAVERTSIGPDLTTAVLYRCRLPFPVLDDEEKRFGLGQDEALLLFDRGFQAPFTDGSRDGVRVIEDVGRLTFRLDEHFAGAPATIILGISDSSRARVTFGGTRVPVRYEGDTMRITISQGLVDLAVRRPLSLEFRAPGEGDLFFKLYSLRATSQR